VGIVAYYVRLVHSAVTDLARQEIVKLCGVLGMGYDLQLREIVRVPRLLAIDVRDGRYWTFHGSSCLLTVPSLPLAVTNKVTSNLLEQGPCTPASPSTVSQRMWELVVMPSSVITCRVIVVSTCSRI
jgi:hypothetical protein